MAGCKQIIVDTSSPENTLSSLEQKYDYVIKASEGWKRQVKEQSGVEDTDTLVLVEGIKGPPPAFRVSGDKIICVNYPGSYYPMTPEEFVNYVNKVKHWSLDK